MDMSSSWALGAISAALFLLAPGVAEADSCAESYTYSVTVHGNDVMVNSSLGGQECGPAPSGSGGSDYATTPGSQGVLLRENEADGTLVVIQNCTWDGAAFLDECVPPGKYRYGYSIPFTCDQTCNGYFDYFGEAEVMSAPAEGCSITNGGPPTGVTDIPAPWSTSGKVEKGYNCPSHSAFFCAARPTHRAVRTMDLLLLAVGLGMMGIRAARRRPRVR